MKRTTEYIRNSLIDYYSHQEIESFIDLIFFHIYNYSKNNLIVRSGEILSETEFLRIKKIVARLKNEEPIQYIFGKTEFYSLIFKVNPAVLIPRNETEELVHLILNDHPMEKLKVLDIGSGSGCIPIALKKNNPNFDVSSCDISEQALDLARLNAKENQTDIHFIHFDILSTAPFPQTNFDLIVSNPPYVTHREKKLMHKNVLDNEPHLALFVPDEDPLIFYRTIVEKSLKILNAQGEIYFEINEAFGNEVILLLEKFGFKTTLIKDLNGKDRMVYAQKRK